MKILIFHNAYQHKGGEDVAVEAEMALLLDAGHDVELFRISNEAITDVRSKIKIFLKAPYDKACQQWAFELVRSTKAEIVHVHNFFPQLTPAIHVGASEAGAAVVQTLHNYRLICANAMLLRNGLICEKCLTGSNIWGVVHRCYRGSVIGSLAVVRMQRLAQTRSTWNSVHKFIALTEFQRSKYGQAGFPLDRIISKPNFVVAPERVSSKRTPTAIFVGRLSEEKGLRCLLTAWNNLPEIPLIIIGDGPDRKLLENLAPRNTTFLGALSREEVKKEMHRASLLVMPSIWYEGFPMTIVEAYSASIPVLAARIGSLSEIIDEGVTGVTFKANDPSDLADKTKQIFANLTKLEEMGQQARDTYERLYTPATNLRQLEAIYKSALNVSRMADPK